MLQELTSKNELALIGEEIGMELGSQMINSYRRENPSELQSYVIGREIIQKILSQPGCVGMRLFNAINENGEKTLVYVGIDRSGKSIIRFTSVNVMGELAAENGIVADRVRIEEAGSTDWWITE